MKEAIEGRGPVDQRFVRAREIAESAVSNQAVLTVGAAMESAALPPAALVGEAAQGAATRFADRLDPALLSVTDLQPDRLEKARLPLLRTAVTTVAEQRASAAKHPASRFIDPWIEVPSFFPYVPRVPHVSYSFCIPPNPLLRSMRMRAELNLSKLHTCRNITGTVREVDIYSAPTDVSSQMPTISGGRLVLSSSAKRRPTPYKYALLVERAKQMTELAAQMEASMLSALEKRDAEAYSALKAQQDVDLAQAQVRLGDLKVTQARDTVQLAGLQREQAEIRADTYSEWLQAGLNDSEQRSLDALGDAVDLSNDASYYLMGAAAAEGTQAAITGALTLGLGAAGELGASLSSMAGSLSAQAQSRSTESSRTAMQASFERRRNDWTLQRAIANQDVRIGRQQEVIALAGVDVATQERTIASMQADHASAVVQFLANKFTNVELYDWMAACSRGSTASSCSRPRRRRSSPRCSSRSNARRPVPPYIQTDYWLDPATPSTATSGQAQDRKGLTGSARLLQDIVQLDQYAFEPTSASCSSPRRSRSRSWLRSSSSSSARPGCCRCHADGAVRPRLPRSLPAAHPAGADVGDRARAAEPGYARRAVATPACRASSPAASASRRRSCGAIPRRSPHRADRCNWAVRPRHRSRSCSCRSRSSASTAVGVPDAEAPRTSSTTDTSPTCCSPSTTPRSPATSTANRCIEAAATPAQRGAAVQLPAPVRRRLVRPAQPGSDGDADDGHVRDDAARTSRPT